MEYTTDCAISFEPDYSKVRDLITECYSGKVCIDGRNSCEVLRQTLPLILNESYPVMDGGAIKGYVLESTLEKEEKPEEVFSVNSGNCTGSFIGNEFLSQTEFGAISTSLRICY
jgi:hypothetical protein